MDEEKKDDALPPHRTLTDYYDSDPERSQYVFDLFNRTAHHYNTIERIFAGELHARIGLATQKPADWVVLTFTQDTRELEQRLATTLGS